MQNHRLFLAVASLLGLVLMAGCAEKPVLSGLDVLVQADFAPLKGKRVGLVTNQTALTREGRHVADLLAKDESVHLAVLFGPEHGIRGIREAGEFQNSALDSATGIQILSLYGDTKKPTPEMLKNIDVLVFDIQDIGTRFYTYISTMFLALESAAENNIPFIVLDRPNPIGGEIVEGPVLLPAYESFVGIRPIPLRHGMTVGELARLFNEEGWLANGVRAELTIVPVKNWSRSMLFDVTGLPWIKPSPNMVNLQTALLYPGMGIVEGTSVSEGRGTYEPFEIIGAPWINADTLAAHLQRLNLEGVAIQAARYTPVNLPNIVTGPKYQDRLCQGVRFKVTKPRSFHSVDLAMHLLCTLRRLYPDSLKFREHGMNRLTGDPAVLNALQQDKTAAEIIAAWQPRLQEFLPVRVKYLLY